MDRKRITLIVNIISTLLCLVCFTACSNRKVKKIEIEGIRLNEYEEIETDEGSFLKDGYFKEWHLNGQISLIGEYCMNKRCGYWKVYKENGDMYEEGTYLDDEKDGLWKEYLKDGQTREIAYKHGNYAKIIGTWIDDDKTTWVFDLDGKFTETNSKGRVINGYFHYNRDTSLDNLKIGSQTWQIKFENDSLFTASHRYSFFLTSGVEYIKNAKKQK